MIHALKILPEFFEELITGRKKYEVRRNDRQFAISDFVGLNEINELGKYTGRCALFEITYVFDNPNYCKEGCVILSLTPLLVEGRENAIRDCRGFMTIYRRNVLESI